MTTSFAMMMTRMEFQCSHVISLHLRWHTVAVVRVMVSQSHQSSQTCQGHHASQSCQGSQGQAIVIEVG